MARNGNRISAVRRLHRSLGALGAIFLLWMAVSGVLVNHSETLGLAARHVSSPMLLDWYGLGGPEQIDSFRAGGDWLSFAGSGLYINGEPLTTLDEGLGAVRTASLLVAAGSRELLLLDDQARLVERLAWEKTGAIEAIGTANGAVFVNAAGQSWVADAYMLTWQALEAGGAAIDWSVPEPAPAGVRDKVAAAYRGEALNLQRVLLDLHSGWFFGTAGVWVYDLLALSVCVIAVSGLALWVRTGRKSRPRNKP
jgi:hypothetical protein